MDFKIIIVDDEVKIVQLIKVLIHWDALPLELAGTANDGVGALDLIRAESPDIVILDMKMPGFNGIELIRRAKKLYSDIHFIIISGYRRFEYAQNAIKFGVEDYLLKPVKEHELNNTLEKVIQKIENRHMDEDKKSHLIEVENRQYEEKFFSDLLNGLVDISSGIDVINSDYHLNFKYSIFEVVLLRNDLNGTEINENEIILLREKTERIVNRTLNSKNIVNCTYYGKQGFYLLLNYSGNDRDLIRESLIGIIERIYSLKDLFRNLNTTIARSGGFTSLNEVNNIIKDVDILIKDRIVRGCGKILMYETRKSPDILLNDIFTLVIKNEIIKCIEILDDNGIKKILDSIQMDLLSMKELRGQLVMDMVEEILETFIFTLKSRSNRPKLVEKELLKFKKNIYFQSSISSLFSLLTSELISKTAEAKRIKQDQIALPIIEVKKYINDNFFMNLSLDNVSSYIGMNPTYFSTLFKKETGIGFLEYLTNVRMEEAKELLGDPKRLISDTASEVGYKDSKHFTKQFKKIVGLSPIEYRKIYY